MKIAIIGNENWNQSVYGVVQKLNLEEVEEKVSERRNTVIIIAYGSSHTSRYTNFTVKTLVS
jgi:hypothetical protein